MGVVPPIKTAGEVSQTRVIGLLATEATVTRPYVRNLAAQFAADCTLVAIGSATLAEMAEEKLRGRTADLGSLRELLSPFFDNPAAPVDTVVLGCTHYPLLLDEFRHVSPPDVAWLDCSPAVARRLQQVLEDQLPSSQRVTDHVLFAAPLGEEPALRAYLAGMGFGEPEDFPD